MKEKKILIIDDSKEVNEILRDYFMSVGAITYTYTEPPNLREVLKEKDPHLILLDFVLPNISGIELLKEIKDINPHIPVIIMTGYADMEKNIESLRMGAYAFFPKPFKNFDEIYFTAKNAITYYETYNRTLRLSEEIRQKLEQEKLNLIELEFLKTLQQLIGEEEDTDALFGTFFKILKKFIPFDILYVTFTSEGGTNFRIFPQEKSYIYSKNLENGAEEGIRFFEKEGFHFLESSLSTKLKSYGKAYILKKITFTQYETAEFNRFCSHLSLALEKILLFNEIKNLSIHDGLTGIYNHSFLIKSLDEEIIRSERYGSPLSIILFDIDDFKRVNDTYGHLAGDAVLKGVAEIFKGNLRNIDIIGRYGGEEFLAILPETDDKKGITVGERLRREVAHKEFLDEYRIKITLSGGLAHYEKGFDSRKLLQTADDYLYQAKRKGKNRICHGKY
ncbi:MAG: diguanylate cyclase [Syntrophorhabdaceae bacterium]|nr:diguanylate cyclase [Syntrophorhabdaceae bacterium]